MKSQCDATMFIARGKWWARSAAGYDMGRRGRRASARTSQLEREEDNKSNEKWQTYLEGLSEICNTGRGSGGWAAKHDRHRGLGRPMCRYQRRSLRLQLCPQYQLHGSTFWSEGKRMKWWMPSLLALTRIVPLVQHVQRRQKRRLGRSRSHYHCPVRQESLALVKDASLVDGVKHWGSRGGIV